MAQIPPKMQKPRLVESRLAEISDVLYLLIACHQHTIRYAATPKK
jgi:hypothetical protein